MSLSETLHRHPWFFFFMCIVMNAVAAVIITWLFVIYLALVDVGGLFIPQPLLVFPCVLGDLFAITFFYYLKCTKKWYWLVPSMSLFVAHIWFIAYLIYAIDPQTFTFSTGNFTLEILAGTTPTFIVIVAYLLYIYIKRKVFFPTFANDIKIVYREF